MMETVEDSALVFTDSAALKVRQLIDEEFKDVTDDEMRLIDAKYDEHAKELQARVWSLAESK